MKDKPVRIELQLISKLKELYGEEREGVERAIEIFLQLRSYTRRSIKDIFTPAEITGMCQSFNGTMMEPKFMCSTAILLAHFDGSEELEAMSSRYGFDYSTFRAKIAGLSPAQCFYIQDEIHRFWNTDSYNQNLDTFISQL